MGSTPDGSAGRLRRPDDAPRVPNEGVPERERRRALNESTEGDRASDLLSDRKAGALLLAFVAAVVVVLAVATAPLISSESMSTHQPTGTARLDR